jgi:putative membrane protein
MRGPRRASLKGVLRSGTMPLRAHCIGQPRFGQLSASFRSERIIMNSTLNRFQWQFSAMPRTARPDSAQQLNFISHVLHALVLGAIIAALAFFCSSSAAFAAGKSSAFLKQAARGDLAETKVGQLAQQKAENADVKAFGQTLVTDHGQHLTEVSNLAKSMNVEMPSQPNQEQKAEYEKLSKLSGKAFDQQFVAGMIEDHQKEIAKYEKEAQSGDPEVAALAKKTLPVLKQHLETAQTLQAKVGQ